MSDLTPAGDHYDSAASEVILLDYGRPGDDALTTTVRGLAIAIVVFSGVAASISLFSGGWGLLNAGSGSIAFYVRWNSAKIVTLGLCHGLYCVGGILVLRRARAGANLICAAAAVALLVLAVAPFIDSVVIGVVMSTPPDLGQFVVMLLTATVTAYIHVLLLYVFSRRLIRGAIGVK